VWKALDVGVSPETLARSVLVCDCGVPCGKCCAFLVEVGVRDIIVQETLGVGLWYDDLSREFVRCGALRVYQIQDDGALRRVTADEE